MSIELHPWAAVGGARQEEEGRAVEAAPVGHEGDQGEGERAARQRVADAQQGTLGKVPEIMRGYTYMVSSSAAYLCMWFGEVCSCCCLPILPHLHSPQNIPRIECCCCEQPISKQQPKLLPFDWILTTTTFDPWDILWTMGITKISEGVTSRPCISESPSTFTSS